MILALNLPERTSRRLAASNLAAQDYDTLAFADPVKKGSVGILKIGLVKKRGS